MPEKKKPVRERKAIMIRPTPEVLEAMQEAAAREGISLNKLALEIIEGSSRLNTSQAAGARAGLDSAVAGVESSIRTLRAALD